MLTTWGERFAAIGFMSAAIIGGLVALWLLEAIILRRRRRR